MNTVMSHNEIKTLFSLNFPVISIEMSFWGLGHCQSAQQPGEGDDAQILRQLFQATQVRGSDWSAGYSLIQKRKLRLLLF